MVLIGGGCVRPQAELGRDLHTRGFPRVLVYVFKMRSLLEIFMLYKSLP